MFQCNLGLIFCVWSTKKQKKYNDNNEEQNVKCMVTTLTELSIHDDVFCPITDC